MRCRIFTLEQAWDTIQESGQEFAITDWQRDELDRRLAEHHVDPDENITTSADFHAELRKRILHYGFCENISFFRFSR